MINTSKGREIPTKGVQNPEMSARLIKWCELLSSAAAFIFPVTDLERSWYQRGYQRLRQAEGAKLLFKRIRGSQIWESEVNNRC